MNLKIEEKVVIHEFKLFIKNLKCFILAKIVSSFCKIVGLGFFLENDSTMPVNVKKNRHAKILCFETSGTGMENS